MGQKSNRRKFQLEYKQKVVDEFLSGVLSAQQIAEREGITAGQIYRKKLHPSFHSERESSGYAEIKRKLDWSKGRAR